MSLLTVAADGSGEYRTIQSAIDAVPSHSEEPVSLYIKNGVYSEKLQIPSDKPNIRLLGESTEGTILTGGDYARMLGPDGAELGTARTAVLLVTADGFYAENLTIRNTAGYGREIGQAIALSISGDRQVLKNVRLLGNQDTLYTGSGRQYYENCYIEGHVDYIFGAATVVFYQCEIHSLRGGFITAASTPESSEHGYVFLDCRLTGKETEETVYLGRPWRPYAHTVFVNTWMGKQIRPEGWDHWGKVENQTTARYAEYGSRGPGAEQADRIPWAQSLTSSEAEKLTLENVLSGTDGWSPRG